MKIQGLQGLSMTNIKIVSDILSKLNIGDKIKVEILSNSNNELTLKLPNGKTITATTLIPIDLNIGDYLELSLKSKTDNQVFFETSKSQDGSQSNQLTNSLISLNILPDERNIEIATKLMENNLPISKENFKNVAELLAKFENINIDKATFILGNDLEINNKNIENLNKFIEKKDVIDESIQKIVNNLSEEKNTDVIDKIANNFNNLKLLQAVDDGNEKIGLELKNFNNNDNNIKQISQDIVKQLVNINLLDESDKSNLINVNNINSKVNKNNVQSSDTKNINLLQNKTIDELIAKIPNKELPVLLEKFPAIKENISKILSKKDLIEKIFNENKQPLLNLENIKENSSKAEKLFQISVSVTKDGLKSDIDGNKLYNDLNLKLELLEKNIGNFQNKSQIQDSVTNIKNEITFMKDINNAFYYVQVPLVLNKNETSMELYVAKNNKKSTKIDPKNSNVFLSLNTKNLGTIEALINVSYSKINFDFKVQDKKIIELLKENEGLLDKLLSSKGYSINRINYSVSSKNTTIVDAGQILKNNGKTDKGVDIRV